MFRYLIVLFLILLTDFSFGQIVLTQTHSDATIGLDRKAWNGLGNTSSHSDGYAHDFTLPASTNPCQKITGITVEISLVGYTNNNVCPHFETYYNLFYGCNTYAGGATCLPATNLIAEPNYAPNASPRPFNFGSPLGSPLNSNIVPDFGDNLSIDIIPVSNPGCNAVTNGHISYQYTITVTVTVTDIPPTPPTFTQVSAICSGDTLSALPTTSNNGITGTWSPALNNTTTTIYTFTPTAGQCATSQTMTIVVNTSVTPTFTQVAAICSGDTLSALPTTSNNGITGTWSPAMDNTTTTIYTFTPAIGQCATSQTMTITVNPLVIPTFTQVAAICSGDSLSALPTTSNEGVTGTWNPALDNTTTTTYTFTPDSGQCATTQTMTIAVNTSVTPTLECWETATFNNTTCSWDVSGTQPVQPNLDCWETAAFNNTTCVWDISGTQPTQPTLDCWETAIFNDTTCSWDVSGTQPVQPTIDCWETATFNNTTCSWDVTGTQPTQPTLECWETATFNNSTCVWDISGTQPNQPTIDCWETATFNNTTCSWDVTGTQPTQPTLECWETATFNNATCVWDITGTQPTQPTLECWETATFNNVTCVWDITGTQPFEFEEEDLTFCEGEDITMFANTTLVSPSYLWDTGEITASKTVSAPGTYIVVVTDNCSTIEITFNVEEIESPIIDSVISDGSSIVISTSNTGDFLYSLDGNSFQTNNIFDNQDGGLYTIHVKGQGCNDVVISNHLHFYIPKFFTPNNDRVNDTFDLKGIEHFGESQVHIFDRYGKLLKSSRKNVPFSWNGTFNNELLQSDDYWYVIIIEGQQFAGHFTLKR